MKDLIKTIDEYKKWKSSIRNILDENYNEIVGFIVDAYGYNNLIALKTSQNNSMLGGQPQTMLLKGIVINQDPVTGHSLLWYFQDNYFYLIERNSDNTLLNVRPQFFDQNNAFQNAPSVRAKFENDVDFMVALFEHSDEIVKILKQRMEKIIPKDAESMIKKFHEAAQ
ncbi:hypothetical protein C9J48_10890 [Photobacterium profundum]|uniref:Uncharacterized protein n=1 Tax=Photobacterium profundum 3TCK TaxID=314280 RepID=Q1YWT9_9GAMM|nr:hypothetical protein [Photobacterium profundum]EAS40763.1 hypothetical protein P3TCK_08753 [Photobacterium profundum 3TCK]PSV62462.1 hypothetical protein C9J48_10890 [Photobacterium profundum]